MIKLKLKLILDNHIPDAVNDEDEESGEEMIFRITS